TKAVHSQQSSVDSPIHTTLRIYNVLGKLVRTLVDEPKEPGTYKVTWDGKDDQGNDVASGIYFYRIKAGDFSTVKKMVLLK
ncbi:MAG: FlgD immunoglobulin-like domain containing protein, partial [Candidatus Zixiibacteriota bacterium]